MKVLFTSWPSMIAVWLLLGVLGICAMFGVRLGDVLIPVIALLAVIMTGASWTTGEQKGWHATCVWIAAFMFLLWTILSYAFSSTQTVGWTIVQTTMCAFLFFSWALHLKKDERAFVREWMLWLLPWIAVLCCAFGALFYVLQPFSRFVGTFLDPRIASGVYPNGMAGFLLLTWPLVWFGMRPGRERRIVSGFLLGCLLLTLSRAAILVALVQITVLSWRSGMTKRAFMETALTLVLTVVVIGGTRSIFFPLPSIVERATFSDASGAVPVTERRSLSNQAATLTFERPLFGWGPGSYLFTSQRYQRGIFGVSDDPHNVLLSLSSERGVMAAALFLCIVVSCMTMAWKHRREPQEYAMLLGTGGVFLHSMVDRDLQFLAIALPFWIFLGLMMEDRASHKRSLIRSDATVGALCSIALLLSLFFAQPGDAALTKMRSLIDAGSMTEGLDVIEEYVQHNGEDPRGWLMFGEALVKNDREDEALLAYDEAFRLGKLNYPDILLGFLSVAHVKNDYALLSARRDDIEHVLGQFAQAIRTNDHYAAVSTAPETLIRVLTEMTTIFPQEEQNYASLGEEIRRSSEEFLWARQNMPVGRLW